MDIRTQMLINESIVRMSEGCITDKELRLLEEALDNNPEAIAYFVDCSSDLSLCEELLQRTILVSEPDKALVQDYAADFQDARLWDALLRQEQTAPAIHEPHEESRPMFVQKVEHVKSSRQFNKRAFYSLVVSAAAILLLVLSIHLVPPKQGYLEAATLTASLNAKWAGMSEPVKEGMRLMTGVPMILREGVAELIFDNNTRVTVEGPAEFEIVSDDRVKLQYGRLYSIVPREAIGFSVATPNAMIIDLGTQFGTSVDFQGNTELHVTEGKTTLVAGEKQDKVSLEVNEGAARKIDGQSSDISEISCGDRLFARSINTQANYVWRGEPIDLADIVGGGNGMGTGQMEKGIDPLTGDPVVTAWLDRWGNGQYVPVSGNRYIDGIFVPDGRVRRVPVSSAGHVFAECPITNNSFYMEVTNSKIDDPAVPVLWKEVPLNEGLYGTSHYPIILMHANLGMTFDLDAIRADYPGTDTLQFCAEVGLSPAAPRDGNADIWVLVDGKVQYCRKKITEKGKAYHVEIPLGPSDRFLTLISTDGADVDYFEPGKRATDSDWTVFARPRLEVYRKE